MTDLAIQGMLDDTDTREKVASPSYKDKEELDFQILLTDNYYVNPSNIRICFPIKIKKKSNNSSNIDGDLIAVNNFLAHWVKEVGRTKYGSDKELLPTFTPWEVYQYSDAMLKHLPKDSLKTLQKHLLYSKENVYYASKGYSDAMLKHLPKDSLKTLQRHLLYSKENVYYASAGYDRRNFNGTVPTGATALTDAKKKVSC